MKTMRSQFLGTAVILIFLSQLVPTVSESGPDMEDEKTPTSIPSPATDSGLKTLDHQGPPVTPSSGQPDESVLILNTSQSSDPLPSPASNNKPIHVDVNVPEGVQSVSVPVVHSQLNPPTSPVPDANFPTDDPQSNPLSPAANSPNVSTESSPETIVPQTNPAGPQGNVESPVDPYQVSGLIQPTPDSDLPINSPSPTRPTRQVKKQVSHAAYEPTFVPSVDYYAVEAPSSSIWDSYVDPYYATAARRPHHRPYFPYREVRRILPKYHRGGFTDEKYTGVDSSGQNLSVNQQPQYNPPLVHGRMLEQLASSRSHEDYPPSLGVPMNEHHYGPSTSTYEPSHYHYNPVAIPYNSYYTSSKSPPLTPYDGLYRPYYTSKYSTHQQPYVSYTPMFVDSYSPDYNPPPSYATPYKPTYSFHIPTSSSYKPTYTPYKSRYTPYKSRYTPYKSSYVRYRQRYTASSVPSYTPHTSTYTPNYNPTYTLSYGVDTPNYHPTYTSFYPNSVFDYSPSYLPSSPSYNSDKVPQVTYQPYYALPNYAFAPVKRNADLSARTSSSSFEDYYLQAPSYPAPIKPTSYSPNYTPTSSSPSSTYQPTSHPSSSSYTSTYSSPYLPPDEQYSPPRGPPNSNVYAHSQFGYNIPPSPAPSEQYQPPLAPSYQYQSPLAPSDQYQPPPVPSDQYQPPLARSYQYQPPPAPSDQYQPPPAPSDQYQPPPVPSDQYQPPLAPSYQYQPPPAPSDQYQPPLAPNDQYQPPLAPSDQYQPPLGPTPAMYPLSSQLYQPSRQTPSGYVTVPNIYPQNSERQPTANKPALQQPTRRSPYRMTRYKLPRRIYIGSLYSTPGQRPSYTTSTSYVAKPNPSSNNAAYKSYQMTSGYPPAPQAAPQQGSYPQIDLRSGY